MKYIKNLKKIVKICLANGWIARDPFANSKATLREIDRVCLTEAEVTKLESTDFENERVQRVKDAFLFSCYTGLAYIDIYQLKKLKLFLEAKTNTGLYPIDKKQVLQQEFRYYLKQ